MSILLTGFEPFAGDTVNPSAELVTRLAGEFAAEVLPVEFAAIKTAIPALLMTHQPSAVVCLGLSNSASGLTLERIAVNLADARIADNSGSQPVDEPVLSGGPVAYFTTLPVKRMLSAILTAGVPGELSMSAGSYVCNAAMYHFLHAAAALPEDLRPRCGFIHVPQEETLDLDAQERGLRAALACVLDTELHYPSGSLD